VYPFIFCIFVVAVLPFQYCCRLMCFKGVFCLSTKAHRQLQEKQDQEPFPDPIARKQKEQSRYGEGSWTYMIPTPENIQLGLSVAFRATGAGGLHGTLANQVFMQPAGAQQVFHRPYYLPATFNPTGGMAAYMPPASGTANVPTQGGGFQPMYVAPASQWQPQQYFAPAPQQMGQQQQYQTQMGQQRQYQTPPSPHHQPTGLSGIQAPLAPVHGSGGSYVTSGGGLIAAPPPMVAPSPAVVTPPPAVVAPPPALARPPSAVMAPPPVVQHGLLAPATMLVPPPQGSNYVAPA